MQKDPTLWLTYFMRARLLARQRRYELAIENCSWVLRKYLNFIEAALLRAQINADLGKYAESLKELDHLVRTPRQLCENAFESGMASSYVP